MYKTARSERANWGEKRRNQNKRNRATNYKKPMGNVVYGENMARFKEMLIIRGARVSKLMEQGKL